MGKDVEICGFRSCLVQLIEPFHKYVFQLLPNRYFETAFAKSCFSLTCIGTLVKLKILASPSFFSTIFPKKLFYLGLLKTTLASLVKLSCTKWALPVSRYLPSYCHLVEVPSPYQSDGHSIYQPKSLFSTPTICISFSWKQYLQPSTNSTR